MTNDETEITPKLLLDHMQTMQATFVSQIAVLSGRIDGIHSSLRQQIEGNHAEMKGEIARLERKIDTLTLGVDSIDARLDAIEIEKLPHRVAVLESRR